MKEGSMIKYIAAGLLIPSIIAVAVVVLYYRGYFTIYSEGYSEAAFQQIHVGDQVSKVLELLGEPLEKAVYAQCIILEDECVQFCVGEKKHVYFVTDPYGIFDGEDIPKGFSSLASWLDVTEEDLTQCQLELWRYSRFEPHKVHHNRALRIDLCTNTVSHKFADLWFP
jgi:hypothetical protein